MAADPHRDDSAIFHVFIISVAGAAMKTQKSSRFSRIKLVGKEQRKLKLLRSVPSFKLEASQRFLVLKP